MAIRARVVFFLDETQINQIGVRAARRRVTDATRATLNRATILTPVDTGRLRAGNDMRVRTRGLFVIGEVFNNTRYAAAVHDGSKPHVIRPKPGRRGRNGRPAALRFTVGGEVIYRRKVNHPGTRAQPWLTTALREVAPRYGFVVEPI